MLSHLPECLNVFQQGVLSPIPTQADSAVLVGFVPEVKMLLPSLKFSSLLTPAQSHSSSNEQLRFSCQREALLHCLSPHLLLLSLGRRTGWTSLLPIKRIRRLKSTTVAKTNAQSFEVKYGKKRFHQSTRKKGLSQYALWAVFSQKARRPSSQICLKLLNTWCSELTKGNHNRCIFESIASNRMCLIHLLIIVCTSEHQGCFYFSIMQFWSWLGVI